MLQGLSWVGNRLVRRGEGGCVVLVPGKANSGGKLANILSVAQGSNTRTVRRVVEMYT